MEDLGLFSLGVFAGSIATIGLQFIETTKDWRLALAVILPAVLSGVVVAFVNRFKTAALGCYPLGLLIGLMWNYMRIAKDDIMKDGIHVALAIAQIVGTVTVTALAVLIVGISAIKYVAYEWRNRKVSEKDAGLPTNDSPPPGGWR